MKLFRTGISNFMYWATWGGRNPSGVRARPVPNLFQFLLLSVSCKVQRGGKPISAWIQDFFKGYSSQAPFISRLAPSLW